MRRQWPPREGSERYSALRAATNRVAAITGYVVVLMRVVMLVAHAPEWRHNWEAAARRVADVVVVRAARAPLPGGFRRVGASEYEIQIVKLQPEILGSPVAATVMGRRYAHLLRSITADHGSVDLLHAHFYSAAMHVAGLGVPFVVSEHTTVFTRHAPPHVVRRSARVARRVYRNAALVMPVSAALEADMHRSGIEGQFRVVPNPIDVDAFPLVERPEPIETVRLLFAQRLAVTKGADVLLRALAVARAREPRLALRIAGDGPERSALERLATTLGIDDRVEFLGHLDQGAILRELHRAHALAFPSRGDSFGLPVVEALLTGLPVIATPFGIVPDVVTTERGLVVPVDDVAALGDALVAFASSRDRYRARSVADGIADRFSSAAVAAELRSAYESVIQTDSGFTDG